MSDVTDLHALFARLEAGRPLFLSADAASSLAARGRAVRDPVEAGGLIRAYAPELADHHHHEIGAGVDILCAATGETMPRALHRLGMAFRSAALTGTAVDLALDAADSAPRPVLVAGLLGSRALSPVAADRMAEEYAMHAARLSMAGCHLLIARGFERAHADASGAPVEATLARLARRAAVVSAVATGLPTWVAIGTEDCVHAIDGEPLVDASQTARAAGATAVLFEIDPPDDEARTMRRLIAAAGGPMGILLAAIGSMSAPEAWAASARRLLDEGARVLGGGPGTTPRHFAALTALLRKGERPSLFPGAP